MTRSRELLEKHLGYHFEDPQLLQQALTHRSAGSRNNERLEFLGDAVLGSVIAAELYRGYPQAREGRLSRLRSTLVRRESLAGIAQGLQLGEYLQLGAGERRSGGHARDSILSDALEAVFGAIYLDSDFATVRDCILALFRERLQTVSEVTTLKDAKTRLQEFLQAQHKPLPTYQVVQISGEAHDQFFRVSCRVTGQDIEPGEGSGSSRRLAEQAAAEALLARLLEAES
ncbi:MAG TPA: ribonuclease III [Gammaproteobacteria bacterium]|nr:ribonuclease III [Gammaproteobacteria bacterium]